MTRAKFTAVPGPAHGQLVCGVMVIITVTIWALERCYHWYPRIHTQDIVRYIQSSCDIELLTAN